MDLALSKTLKLLIRQRGMTTSELARQISVSPKTISDWLAGGRTPRDMDAVRRCAQFLNVSFHYLLFGEEDAKSLVGELLRKTEVHTGLYEISIRRVEVSSR